MTDKKQDERQSEGQMPEVICPAHGRLGSPNGYCPRCETPRTDDLDILAPDTLGDDDWKNCYFRLLKLSRSLEKEAAINAENFHVTNQALVKYDEARIVAEERAAQERRVNLELIDSLKDMENHRDAVLLRAERAELRLKELERDAGRYRKLKAAITVPHAMQSFLRHMNWHPDTFNMGIDEAIDEAMNVHSVSGSTGETRGGR